MRFVWLLLLCQFAVAATVETRDIARNLVYFEPGLWQSDTDLRYWVRGTGDKLRLTSNALQFRRGLGYSLERAEFATGTPEREESDATPFRVHQYIGATAADWRPNLSGYRTITYRNARPGVDVAITAGESLGVVATIAKPGAYFWQFPSSTSIEVNGTSVAINGSFFTISFRSLSAWQVINGIRTPVSIQFVVEGNQVRFAAGNYVSTQPLFIGFSIPFVRERYSFTATAIDIGGNQYLATPIESDDRCTTTSGGRTEYCSNVLVTALRPNGQPLYVAHFGGVAEDFVSSVAITTSGDLFIAGSTYSANFPITPGAYQITNTGPIGPRSRFDLRSFGDGYLLKLDRATGQLRNGTFYGVASEGESLAVATLGDQHIVRANDAVLRFDASLSSIAASYKISSIRQPAVASGGDVLVIDGATGELVRLNAALTAPLWRASVPGQIQHLADEGAALWVDSTNVRWLSFFGSTGSELSRANLGAAPESTYNIALTSPNTIALAESRLTRTSATTTNALLIASCRGYRETAPFLTIVTAAGVSSFASYFPPTVNAFSIIGLTPTGRLLLVEPATLKIHELDRTAPTPNGLACVTGGASRAVATGIAPGQIVTLIGNGLATDGKTEVRVNNIPAPLLYMSAQQINAVIPYEGLAIGGTATIEVISGANRYTSTSAVRAGAVELFTLDGSGDGPAVALNQDGSVNTAANPAAPGSIVVLYGTGIGATTPASVTGAVAPLTGPGALAQPLAKASAWVNNAPATLLYGGAAPGLINGAAQFNVVLPNNAAGLTSVEIRLDGIRSISNTVFVRP